MNKTDIYSNEGKIEYSTHSNRIVFILFYFVPFSCTNARYMCGDSIRYFIFAHSSVLNTKKKVQNTHLITENLYFCICFQMEILFKLNGKKENILEEIRWNSTFFSGITIVALFIQSLCAHDNAKKKSQKTAIEKFGRKQNERTSKYSVSW